MASGILQGEVKLLLQGPLAWSTVFCAGLLVRKPILVDEVPAIISMSDGPDSGSGPSGNGPLRWEVHTWQCMPKKVRTKVDDMLFSPEWEHVMVCNARTRCAVYASPAPTSLARQGCGHQIYHLLNHSGMLLADVRCQYLDTTKGCFEPAPSVSVTCPTTSPPVPVSLPLQRQCHLPEQLLFNCMIRSDVLHG
jgi:hypothetical protein